MSHTNNKEVRQKLIEVYYKDFNNYNDIDVKFEDVYNFLHQELQKARHDWLRGEIVRLEGMKTSFVPADSEWFGDENYDKGEWKLVPAKDPAKAMYCLTCERFLPEEGCTCGTVQIQTIIDRYHSELDQLSV